MRLTKEFYQRQFLEVAPDTLGKIIVRRFSDGSEFRGIITEVEAYGGEEDLACHASRGRTPRTEVMYSEGGLVYVYFIYGMYWLLNVVTGPEEHPQAVLIRSLAEVEGPGRIGRTLRLDKSFYGEDLLTSNRLWLEENPDILNPSYTQGTRINVDYGREWAKKPWRFILEE